MSVYIELKDAILHQRLQKYLECYFVRSLNCVCMCICQKEKECE